MQREMDTQTHGQMGRHKQIIGHVLYFENKTNKFKMVQGLKPAIQNFEQSTLVDRCGQECKNVSQNLKRLVYLLLKRHVYLLLSTTYYKRSNEQ
jgi:hypothetical protein